MKNTHSLYLQGSHWCIGLLFVAACLLLLAFFLSLNLSLADIQSVALDALAYVEANPWRGALIFAVFYGVICALPTPLISVFTMLAGYLFGNVLGLLLVSFMSAIGNTLLFLMVRYSLRDWVGSRLLHMPSVLQKAASADNFSAALSLRLIPGLPFPMPAVVLALSHLKLWKFYLSTQLGLFITLAVYVNAGCSFAEVTSLEGIFSPQLILSLLLLAIVPWLLGFARKHFNLLFA